MGHPKQAGLQASVGVRGRDTGSPWAEQPPPLCPHRQQGVGVVLGAVQGSGAAGLGFGVSIQKGRGYPGQECCCFLAY